MSLLQRSLDPEKTLGLVDVLYTSVFDITRWKERKSVRSSCCFSVAGAFFFFLYPVPVSKLNNNGLLLNLLTLFLNIKLLIIKVCVIFLLEM